MAIERIDALQDSRFRDAVLKQHGAFLVDGRPCEVEITGEREAVVICPEDADVDGLIGLFRYFAEHITVFYDAQGRLLREYPPVELFEVPIDRIRPSQFYVDRAKLEACASFVHTGDDVIVPLNADGDGFISLDGHSRLYLAAQKGIKAVRGFIAETNDDVRWFAQEAQRRGVSRIDKMEELSHEDYVEKWHRFCDEHFAGNT